MFETRVDIATDMHTLFIEQETLPSLLSTGWFQEWILSGFHNQTKTN